MKKSSTTHRFEVDFTTTKLPKFSDLRVKAAINKTILNASWLEYAGYISVVAGNGNWQDIHAWCKDHFSDDYTWTGNIFWFRDDRHAMMFAIAWGG